jgi:hypothetical protein
VRSPRRFLTVVRADSGLVLKTMMLPRSFESSPAKRPRTTLVHDGGFPCFPCQEFVPLGAQGIHHGTRGTANFGITFSANRRRLSREPWPKSNT